MSRSRVFVGMMISFAAGILLASRFNFGPALGLYMLAGATVGFVVVRRRQWNIWMTLALFLLCVGAGMWRLAGASQNNQFQRILNEKVQLDGIISADVDVRIDHQLLTFQPYGFSQSILISIGKSQHYTYGDRIVVNGKVSLPKINKDFDYASYLRRFNTYALMSYPKIFVVRPRQGSWITDTLLKTKYLFIGRVNAILPETENSLLLGILIGARKTLPQEVIDNFNATGTSHIIAISGYNISVIISGLAFMVFYIGRRWNMWLTLIVVAAFVIMSGASSSVVRAAVMGSLFMLASRAGRMYSLTPSLCLAACAMLAWNPYILYWDASFQLSFLATAGIIYIVPAAEELTKTWPNAFGLKSIIITTFAAIIATLPLILHSFGRLSLIAPVANMVILPIVPLTMLVGFLTAMPVVGPGFGLFAHWLLKYILFMTAYLAHVPHASAQVSIGAGMVIIMYIGIAGGCFLLNWWVSRRALSDPHAVV